MVENIVGKGEIADYEQFFLFPQCFQRLLVQPRKNQGLFEKGLSPEQAWPKIFLVQTFKIKECTFQIISQERVLILCLTIDKN